MEDKIFYGRQDEQATVDAQPELMDDTYMQKLITEDDIAEAASILNKYKSGKANLENRVVEDEKWYKLQHWDLINAGKTQEEKERINVQSTSAWMFNTIANKHADAMDNYPEPVVLPRERSDEASAKLLSEVLPVVMEYNKFRRTYSSNTWEKLKHGTAVYGVFWDSQKMNGLGDINITELDMLNVFWEPGINDIQKSRNLFIVDIMDTDILKSQYPECANMQGNGVINLTKYLYDESIDTSDKSMVVDWYYKRRTPDGRTLLHYCKFVNNIILYASENDPDYRDTGYYAHGLYPVVFDVLFPEKGMPTGFGFVAITRNPQLYIDKLSSNILENSIMATKKRFFASDSTNINEAEFKDWTKPIVHVEGAIDPSRLQEIVVQPLPGIYENVLQQKIEEMKETSSNRDVTSGGTASGITAASAIAALQEAGNKQSRDIIATSYDYFTDICELVIELMRQFYDEPRTFRITNQMPGDYQFVDMSNALIAPQMTGMMLDGQETFRVPIFDLKIKAQKKNPFSRMEENERAKELYAMGFFNPERAQEALLALEMMDFEGKEKIIEQVQQGQTLLNLLNQAMQTMAMMSGAMGVAQPMPEEGGGAPAPQEAPKSGKSMVNGPTAGVMESRAQRLPYAQRLAQRSTPNMDLGNASNTGARG